MIIKYFCIKSLYGGSMIPVDPKIDKELDEYFSKRKFKSIKMKPENHPMYDASKYVYKGIRIDQMSITELRNNLIELCEILFKDKMKWITNDKDK